MSDNPLSNVSRVELDMAGRLPRMDNSAVSNNSSPKTQAPKEENGAPAEQAAKAVEAKPEKSPNPLADVSLKFKIDEKTKDVTILILDRASHKVVRSIPPEDMNKMNPGELLELFA